MEGRMRSVSGWLCRAMLALLLALLGAALAVGASQGPEYGRALILGVVMAALCQTALPPLSRRLAGLGAVGSWLLLTLLCLAVKGTWIALVRVPPAGDYQVYWGYAQALAQREVVFGGRYMALFPHLFGYAAFLSVFVRLLGARLWLAPVLNVALSAASASLLYLLARRWRGGPAAVSVCLLWILCPSQTIYNSMILSEPLYTTLLLGVLLLSAEAERRSWRPGRAALAGGGAGVLLRLLNGVRPIAAVPMLALVIWRFLLSPGELGRRRTRRCWLPWRRRTC